MMGVLPTDETIAEAKRIMFELWRERARERGEPVRRPGIADTRAA